MAAFPEGREACKGFTNFGRGTDGRFIPALASFIAGFAKLDPNRKGVKLLKPLIEHTQWRMERYKASWERYTGETKRYMALPPEIVKAAHLEAGKLALENITEAKLDSRFLCLSLVEQQRACQDDECLEDLKQQLKHLEATQRVEEDVPFFPYNLPLSWTMTGIIISSLAILTFGTILCFALLWKAIRISLLMFGAVLVPIILVATLRLAGYAIYFRGFQLFIGNDYIAAPTLMRVAEFLALGVVLVLAWLWSSIVMEMRGSQKSAIWTIGRFISLGVTAGTIIYMILGAVAVGVAALGTWTQYDLFFGALTQFFLTTVLFVVCLLSFSQAKTTTVLELDNTVRRAFNRILVAQSLLVVSSILYLAYTIAITFFRRTNLFGISLTSQLLFYASFAIALLSFYAEAHARRKGESLLQKGDDYDDTYDSTRSSELNQNYDY